MIIVSDKNYDKPVFFPRNLYTDSTDSYTVTLFDRGTNKSYGFDVTDRHLASYDFWSFDMDFTATPSGEYEYRITDSNGNTVGTGIIRLNALENENVYYSPKFTYDKLNG